jgi:hypothetical protein
MESVISPHSPDVLRIGQMKRRIQIFIGIIFFVVLPNSALADMMRRTTLGDMIFFFVEILLVIGIVVMFLLWIITLLTNPRTEVKRFLGFTTLKLVGVLIVVMVLGKIYYHYLGYGTQKNATAKVAQTFSLLIDIDTMCAEFQSKHGKLPRSTQELINTSREIYSGDYPYDENIRQGEFIDSWGTPLECTFEANKVTVHSAGPDRMFNTYDDLGIGK